MPYDLRLLASTFSFPKPLMKALSINTVTVDSHVILSRPEGQSTQRGVAVGRLENTSFTERRYV
jgi:hypothetical protein